MRCFVCFVVATSGLLCPVSIPCQDAPTLSGFVTRAGTPADFYVDEVRVVCKPGSTSNLLLIDGRHGTETQTCPQRILGESLSVYGRKDRKRGSIEAERIENHVPVEVAVSGLAIVDRVLSPLKDGAVTLRADGYPLLITPKSKVTFAQGSALSIGQVGANVWVQYAGTLRTDGYVAISSVLFTPNTIGKSEDRMRTKTDFDAEAVEEKDRQSGFSKFLKGFDFKKIPAYKDAAMQARVESIGAKLVPEFQRALPEDDPTHIDFRFQVVDLKEIRDSLTLPSGIILVPYQVVKALPNDSQLAAVLAADIAEVMEKQAVRLVPAARAMTATAIAGAVGGLIVPGLGLATTIGNAFRDHPSSAGAEQPNRTYLDARRGL